MFFGVLSLLKQAEKKAVSCQDEKRENSPPKSIKGRRTGRNVLKGKNIRTKEDGTQNFEDYWTEYTSSTDSMDVHLSNCSISSTSDACVSPDISLTTDGQRNEVSSTMDFTLKSENVETSMRLSSTNSETSEENISQFDNEPELTEKISCLSEQSMQANDTSWVENESINTEILENIKIQYMHIMNIRDSSMIGKEMKTQKSRKQSMAVMEICDSPAAKKMKTHESRKQSMAVMETCDYLGTEKMKTLESRKQSMAVMETCDSPNTDKQPTQESRKQKQNMEEIKIHYKPSENKKEETPRVLELDNLKLKVPSVQSMAFDTPVVQKVDEIELKDTSLKEDGIKEVENTVVMERDTLDQENENNIHECNPEFDSVALNKCSKEIPESVAKRKYKKRKNNEITQEIRKSCRNRTPPLAYWKGERQFIRFFKSGEIDVSIIYEEKEHSAKSHRSWNTDKFLLKRNASKHKKVSILNKKRGTKKVLLHSHYEDIWPDQLCQNTGFTMVDTLKSRNMSSGFIKIEAGHNTKNLKPKYNMHFVVISGYVVIHIKGSKIYLKKQDSFKIPKKNTYWLENYGNSKAVLYFSSEK